MTIKSVSLSITIARPPGLGADVRDAASLASLLQKSIHGHLVKGLRFGFSPTGDNVVVTPIGIWAGGGKLSVFIRNLDATVEAIDQLSNLLQEYTNAILWINALSPARRVMPWQWRVTGSPIGIDVAVEWMEVEPSLPWVELLNARDTGPLH
jgi:hypothetical protein